MRPGTTALLDQATAATTETTRIMAGLAELEGTSVRHVEPGPVHRAIISRLRTQALSGQLTLCPDLSYDAPRPAFWCAWAPGRASAAPAAPIPLAGAYMAPLRTVAAITAARSGPSFTATRSSCRPSWSTCQTTPGAYRQS